jgi:hypothetical protein
MMLAVLAAVIATLIWLWPKLRALFARRRVRPVFLDGDPSRRRILGAYRAAQRKLRVQRVPSETPRELARALHNLEWDALTGAVEHAAYNLAPVPADMALSAEALVRRLRPFAHTRLRAPRPPLRPSVQWPRPPEWAVLNPREQRWVALASIGMGVIGYGLAALVTMLLNGTRHLPLFVWLGSLPAIALTLAAGAALITVTGARLSLRGVVAWGLLGGLGMAAFGGLSALTSELALLGLVPRLAPEQVWWEASVHLPSLILTDVLFILPLSVAVGGLLGLVFFGAAGGLWANSAGE